MHIDITLTRDRSYARHVARTMLARQGILVHVVGALFVLLGIITVTAGGAAVVSGAGLVVIGVLFGTQPFRWPSRLVNRVSDRMFGPHRYLLTDQAYRVSSGLLDARYDWALFSEMVETSRAVILLGERRQVRADVPKDGLTADQLAELRAFLAARQAPVRPAPPPPSPALPPAALRPPTPDRGQ